jgi:hypothetical protein
VYLALMTECSEEKDLDTNAAAEYGGSEVVSELRKDTF